MGLRDSDPLGRVALIARGRVVGPPDADRRPHDDGPLRVQLVRFSSASLADDCCGALLAIHAAAIQRNLDCVLTSVDPEGPHQFRVALRRLRVVLRTFRPILRTSVAEPLVASARRIAAIVSELRDADVLIDEILAPAALAERRLATVAALTDWRHEVRGRVRARLINAGAPAFVARLNGTAQSFAWRKRNQKKTRYARDLIAEFVERSGARVALAVAQLPNLTHEQVHDVRKEVKSLRYAVELADALSLNPDRDLAGSLKRAQDALGFVNDIATLEAFAAPLGCEQAALESLRRDLIATHAQAVEESIARAAARLQGIEARTRTSDWADLTRF